MFKALKIKFIHMLQLLLACILCCVSVVTFSDSNELNQIFQTRLRQPSAIRAISPKKLQFVLVYRASCPHCQRFDPIITAYAKQHHIKLLGLRTSTNGFPNIQSIPLTPKIEQTLFGHQGGISVPSLFLVYRPTKDIFAVSVGEMSAYQLNARMQDLLAHMIAYENQREGTFNAR